MKTYFAYRGYLWVAALTLLMTAGASAQVLTILHSFSPIVNSTNSDGANPEAGLLLSGGTLYGTCQNAGSGTGGTVFKLGTDGTGFQVLHSFSGYRHNDGLTAAAGLILSGSTLFGTTVNGGFAYPNNGGTVYALNTDGSGFNLLYAFQLNPNGGMQPYTALTMVSGTLFGTTPGWVFSINPDGSGFTTLHAASGTDGKNPYGWLAVSGSTLYGTTFSGGSWSNGTVFAINTDGSGYTNLHSFLPNPSPGFTNSDGAEPFCGVVVSGDTLYGVAIYGGSIGAGTVFAVRTNGTAFRTLHSFSGTDGTAPSGLALSGNTIYGTASGGGAGGNGTLFSINTDGTGFGTLLNFAGASNPTGALVLSGNTLYGITAHGGSAGNGTVFSVSFLPQLAINPMGQNVIVTWPTNYAAGFSLQSTTNLLSGVWTTVTPGPEVIGNENVVTNRIAGTGQFYRLIH